MYSSVQLNLLFILCATKCGLIVIITIIAALVAHHLYKTAELVAQ